MKVLDKIKKISWQTWMLTIIILVGIFLRTWHFSDWMEFENDQARDATLVSDIVTGKSAWPLLGPTMRGSDDLQGNLFHLGPMYYYFEIMSAEIFGNWPDKLAYPDLFFSILVIPLLFYFLKKYFSSNLSLALTGLYAISYFAIEYSRFAWNPNSIPFFTLVFLLALYELLLKKEKTAWFWVVLAGISLGIGVQLHIIILLLFTGVASLVFVYLLKNNLGTWRRIIIILFIAIALNAPQIVSEVGNNFSNSKILVSSTLATGSKSNQDDGGLWKKLGLVIDFQIEANSHMLSSVGSDQCFFVYGTILEKSEKNLALILNNPRHRKIKDVGLTGGLFFGFLLSLLGYILLIWRAWQEKNEERRIFLRLIVIYATLSFFIMLPIASEKFDDFRYFNQVFFVPFILVGLIADFLKKYLSKFSLIIISAGIFFLAITNLISLNAVAHQLIVGNRSNVHLVPLGEAKQMTKYLESASGGRTIYLLNPFLIWPVRTKLRLWALGEMFQ